MNKRETIIDIASQSNLIYLTNKFYQLGTG